MDKDKILELTKGGFVVGDRDYPDNLLPNKKYTSSHALALDMYDADLIGASYWHCSSSYRDKIKQQLAQKDAIKVLRQSGVDIEVDGKLLLKKVE